MPLPVPPVPNMPAGYGPLPADFNGWLKDSLTFLVNPPICRVRRTTAQTIPSGANTVFQFDAVDEDTYSGWDGTNFRYNAQVSGWYLVITKASALVAGAATTHAIIPGISVTGQVYQANEAWHVTADTSGQVTAHMLLYLQAGIDWVQGLIFLASVSLNTPTANGQQPAMDISWWSA